MTSSHADRSARSRGVVLGIDIGGTAVKAALSEGDGFRVATSTAYARPDRETLRAAVREAVDALGAPPPDGVGLCVPGRRAPDERSIELTVNVPGLVGYIFDDLIAEGTGCRCQYTLLSDAAAATIDAAADYPGKRRVLGIAIGTGVGVALVENGVPVGIGGGSIGHLGQIDIGPIASGPDGCAVVGPDGGRDSLEGYLGAPVLRHRFGDSMVDRLGRLEPSDPAVIALARTIRICLAIYEPDVVVLLGGIALAMRPSGPVIDRAIRDGLTSVVPACWDWAFGSDRHHAARGACRVAAKVLA